MTNVLLGFLLVGVFLLGMSVTGILRSLKRATTEPEIYRGDPVEQVQTLLDMQMRRLDYQEERVRDMLENTVVQLHRARHHAEGYSINTKYDDMYDAREMKIDRARLAHQAYDQDLYNAEPHFEFPAVKPPQSISGTIPWTEPDAPYQSKWGSHPDEVNMRTAPYTVAHCEERPEDCADRQA